MKVWPMVDFRNCHEKKPKKDGHKWLVEKEIALGRKRRPRISLGDTERIAPEGGVWKKTRGCHFW